MNKDAIFTSSGKTPKQSSATKLHISPMSPLNIQTLKNNINEQTDLSSNHQLRNHNHHHQNGNILLQPKHSLQHTTFHNNGVQLTTAFLPATPTAVPYTANGTTKSAATNVDHVLLQRIIAKDVSHPRTTLLAEKSVDSRNTVVKKAPGGTVQITYKNMINVQSSSSNVTNQASNNPVFILPKPVINGIHSNQQQQQLPVTHLDFASHPSPSVSSPYSTESSYITNKSQNQIKKSLNELNSTSVPSWMSCTTQPNDFSNDMIVEQTQIKGSDISHGHSDDIVMSGNDMSPFNGIDIDLSCLASEPFDALQLQQFYQNCNETDMTTPTNDNLSSSVTDNNSNGQNEIQMIIDSVPSHMDSFYDQTACFDNCSRSTELISIIDVSPEIAVSTGGIKIILIGSWNAKNSRYQCRFGLCVVDAELIQNGVLRCYSPKHKPASVKLTVLCNGQVISKDTEFNFIDGSEKLVATTDKNHEIWLSMTNKSLIHLLVERISFIAFMLTGEELKTTPVINLDAEENQIEDRLIDICKTLMAFKVNANFDYNTEGMMTVLHLSSALGYIKLIQLFMNWVESNPSPIILAEACPTCVDQYSLIPIMWSSAKGHFNTTCVLHQWMESTIEARDSCGCTALSLATENGHESLVEYLGRLLKKSTISRENSLNQESGPPNQSKILSSTPPSYPNPNSVASSCVSSLSKDDDSSPRTLGKTLAFIQSMLNDPDGDEKHEDEDEEEASIFTTPDFVHTRQRSITDESIASSSQLSPASPAQSALQSPFNRQMRETAEFYEFFYKAKKIEKDFAELTLTDQEQEELYRAANVIQTAYKSYKERRKQRDQEFSSATLIQSYYRRYKQYAAFKKMQKGAVLIQNQYRAHRAKKKSEAASIIQTHYRRYRQRKYDNAEHTSIQEKTRLEQQAGRKVHRYLKQTTKRFSRELPDEFNSSNPVDCDAFDDTNS